MTRCEEGEDAHRYAQTPPQTHTLSQGTNVATSVGQPIHVCLKIIQSVMYYCIVINRI